MSNNPNQITGSRFDIFGAKRPRGRRGIPPPPKEDERSSANPGGRSKGQRPGGAGYIRGRAPDKTFL